MNLKDTDLFPYPHIINNEMRDGSIISWPDICRSCTKKACFAVTDNEIGNCSSGYDFQRIDKDIIIGGILIKEETPISASKRKRIRRLAG